MSADRGTAADQALNALPADVSDDATGRVANSSRRLWLKSAGATGLMLAVSQSGYVMAQTAAAAVPVVPKFGGDNMPGGLVDDPLVFVSIGADGIVTVVCHRSEMGQGVRTSLAMVVADELEADWAQVRVEQAPGDEARYGNQNTDGSRSIRHSLDPLHRVGAAARSMLEAAAAANWGVAASEVQAKNHRLVHTPSGRSLGFGEVAVAAAKLPVPARAALRLKTPAEFRYIGKGNTVLIDGADIVSGRAKFGADIRLTGMVYAVVARPPVLGGRLK
ncbi:molybdopterin cofactor-binding domain-containing protein, partial [Roseateles sp. GG27B]